ncbi:hypothetical protein [Sphingomonas sp. Leaf4]|uniref:hypothetical protein n=1 Tax=Sphingomonas sp. Leaf4 TaxID=2876553 RepID=UPI001E2A4D0E|nr:hypothetical protein [Sphingomonas sp. Leaf4]
MTGELSGSSQRLYRTLSALAGAGTPCPTNDDLGEQVGCDPRAVARAFIELRDRDLISVEPVRNRRRVTITSTGRMTGIVAQVKRIRASRRTVPA